MRKDIELLEQELNNPDLDERLFSLRNLKVLIDTGDIPKPSVNEYAVNNHIHTTYSFSPYSPSKSIWMAYKSGLVTAGIMDHDSISGAKEFISAGKIIGMATTIGVECRVDFSSTPLKGRKLNNPDQETVAYISLHGIPHTKIDTVKDYFSKYQKERNKRNKKMVDRLNSMMKAFDINIDFDRDVVPLSKYNEGGTITERHILFALSLKLIDKFGKGEKLVNFLKDTLRINLTRRIEGYLLDPDNEYYAYDLLGALKAELVPRFFIPATTECPPVEEIVKFSKETGSILAYAYLGDITESVTGDKRSEKFEDDYLDLLFEVLKGLDFDAVTYMPSRNTIEQLKRVKALCDRFGLFQISGEDINSPRQSFICEKLKLEEFRNLIDSTWALIGHEILATEDISKGMFSEETKRKYPDLNERIRVYSEIGRKSSINREQG
ncbi:TPA: PHP domain-containing protein [bacterium]|nr:PHP domain-containing protein [bacterium]